MGCSNKDPHSPRQMKIDVCDVTLSVYPHRASLKNMLGWYSKGHRFDSHHGQAYFSSLPAMWIYTHKHHKHHIHLSIHNTTQKKSWLGKGINFQFPPWGKWLEVNSLSPFDVVGHSTITLSPSGQQNFFMWGVLIFSSRWPVSLCTFHSRWLNLTQGNPLSVIALLLTSKIIWR